MCWGLGILLQPFVGHLISLWVEELGFCSIPTSQFSFRSITIMLWHFTETFQLCFPKNKDRRKWMQLMVKRVWRLRKPVMFWILCDWSQESGLFVLSKMSCLQLFHMDTGWNKLLTGSFFSKVICPVYASIILWSAVEAAPHWSSVASRCLFLMKSPLAKASRLHCAELQQVSVGKLMIPSFQGEGGFAQCGHCRPFFAWCQLY